jgi:hypothetical protein
MMEIRKGRPDDVWNTDPLTWRGVTMSDGKRSATVCCANGHSAHLADHSIAPDGTVLPSLFCPEEGCTWHQHVKLLGWATA